MKVIIAAAGTGGHINPGIAIANKIKEKNKDANIIFIGTTRGLEGDLVPRAGYELKKIEAHGFTRKLNMENVKNMIKTLKGVKEARKIVKDFNPGVVIGTGGYICGPVMLAAKKYNIPTVLHESNAFPGVTIKLLSKKVDKVLVGFNDAISRLPKAKKVVLTGTPTKMAGIKIEEEKILEMKEQLGFEKNLPVILIFGGSQGAQSINKTLIEIIKNKLNKKYQIMWAAGPKQYDKIKEELQKDGINIENIEKIKIVPYIYNMEEVMNMCDMIIARSGAMTITEIAKVGKAAIFIPYPYATENHQEYNARVLEKVGAAKIILDKDLNSEILTKTIEDIILTPNKLKEMGKKAKTVEIPNVEEKIYKEIIELLR